MENARQKKEDATVSKALWIRQTTHSTNAYVGFVLNAVTFAIILINLRYSHRTILEWLFGAGGFLHSIGLVLDIAALTICGFNLGDLFLRFAVWFWRYFTGVPIVLTPAQKKLLGIEDDDVLFQSTPVSTPKQVKSGDSTSPYSFADLSWLFHLTPKKRRSPGTPSVGTANTSSYGFYGSGSSSSPNFYQSSTSRVRFSPDVCNYQTATSWSLDDASFNEALEKVRRRGFDSSPFTTDERSPPRSILKKTNFDTPGRVDAAGDHSAKSYGSWRSPTSFSSPQGQSPTEYRFRSGIVAESDFTSPAKSVDFSALASFKYQPSPQNLSIDSPAAPSTGTATALGSSASKSRIPGPSETGGDPIWSRYGVTNSEIVEEQCLRLRLWISTTIMKPILTEIDSLNSKAAKSVSISRGVDFVIGESSLLQLQSIVASKLAEYPTLGALLPYLELSTNQGYLVERIRELGQVDACLKDFRWNSGSQYKNKPWDERLPTDTDVIVHIFLTYMNSRLPLNPLHTEGKSFSSQYFIQHPTKPKSSDEKGKSYLVIYQNSIAPPNFQLIVGDKVLETAKGKNNFFGTLLLFFHHLKSNCDGRLDSVNLGKSGLNILWVLD